LQVGLHFSTINKFFKNGAKTNAKENNQTAEKFNKLSKGSFARRLLILLLNLFEPFKNF